MFKGYTKRQHELLSWVSGYSGEHGFAPTLDEIAEAFGISKVTVLEHLQKLEEKGSVRRDRYQSRAIEILDPEFQPAGGGGWMLMGRVAAGQAIEAIETPEPRRLEEIMPTGPDYYLLEVRGDSMVEDGILDGDFVVIEKRSTAYNGETVVAAIGDSEAPNDVTLKRYYHEGDHIRLQPANANMRPIRVRNVEIRGVLRGVVRSLRRGL